MAIEAGYQTNLKLGIGLLPDHLVREGHVLPQLQLGPPLAGQVHVYNLHTVQYFFGIVGGGGVLAYIIIVIVSIPIPILAGITQHTDSKLIILAEAMQHYEKGRGG